MITLNSTVHDGEEGRLGALGEGWLTIKSVGGNG